MIIAFMGFDKGAISGLINTFWLKVIYLIKT
jgi:hypothetical protein